MRKHFVQICLGLFGLLYLPLQLWATEVSYTVQAGDTLSKLARQYNVSVADIMLANNLSNANQIYIGQILVIPSAAVATDAPIVTNTPSVTPITTATPTVVPATPAASVYVVQRGDNLTRIAQKLGTSVTELMQINQLTSTQITAGQQLLIPALTNATPSGSSQPTSNPSGHRLESFIFGTDGFRKSMLAILDWLRTNDLEAYQRVDTYIGTIVPSPMSQFMVSIKAKDGSCRVGMHPGSDIPYLASILYHEASHCVHIVGGIELPSAKEEVFAYSEQLAFMQKHHLPEEQIAHVQEMLAYYAEE